MTKEFDHDVHLVTRQEQYQEIGSDLYYGALLDKVSAGVNPAQYVAGLAYAAEKAGASIHSRTRVRTIEQRKLLYFVQTEHGTLTAKNVLVATNGYIDSSTPKFL